MNSMDAFRAVIDALESLKTPYMVVGAISANVYGIPRSTKDADIVVDLGDALPTAIAQKLGPQFRLDPQMSFETVTGSPRYVLRYLPTPFEIELFPLRDDEFHQSRFARRRQAEMEGRTLWVPSPEDVIVMKLRWGATKRRTKDIDDVVNILTVQRQENAPIDWNYIHYWCGRHGTRELLDKILKSIEP